MSSRISALLVPRTSFHRTRTHRRLGATAAVVLCTAGLLAGCAGSPPPAALPAASAPAEASSDPVVEQPAGAIEITVSDTSFSPADLSVAVGDTVIVTNVGQLEHSWTSQDAGIDSGVLAPGETFSFTAETPGTFSFNCTVHPAMTGSITITD
jgi:plastocyanin